MDTKIAPFTKAELLADVRNLFYVFANEMGRIFLVRDSLYLLGLDPAYVAENYGDDEALLKAVEKKLPSYEFTRYLMDFYDYAYEGILYRDRIDWSIVEEDILPFFDGLLEMSTFLENNATVDFRYDRCQEVIDLAMARHFLDEGCHVFDAGEHLLYHLTLRQVALLSGLDEKTVRNLANRKAKNHLPTVNLNGRTYVDGNIASEWLVARGFKQTMVLDNNVDRDISRAGFYSLEDIGQYVKVRRELTERAITEVASALGGKDALPWIEAVEEGKLEFNQDYCQKLAKELSIDQRDFTLAALKVYQKQQLALVEQACPASKS